MFWIYNSIDSNNKHLNVAWQKNVRKILAPRKRRLDPTVPGCSTPTTLFTILHLWYDEVVRHTITCGGERCRRASTVVMECCICDGCVSAQVLYSHSD